MERIACPTNWIHSRWKGLFELLVGELAPKIKVRCASHETVSSKSARCLLPYFPPADRGVCWGLRAGTKTWADGFRSFRSHRGATCRLGSRQGKGAPRQFRDATWIPVFPDIRRDIPDTYELPLPLFEYFLKQVDKYGGASDATLQQLR